MTQKEIIINTTLDARAAAYFVQTASKFSSEIHVKIEDREVNAKSIMGTIALNMQIGQKAILTANGDDAEIALDDLSKLLA